MITTLEADAKTRPAMKKKISAYAGAEHGELFPIVDGALAQAFPKHVFYVLRFRMFPVARMTPEGLKPSNVFVVAPDGAAQLLADSDATKSFSRPPCAPSPMPPPPGSPPRRGYVSLKSGAMMVFTASMFRRTR